MVAATFSWPVATPAVMAPKATLAQELSQLVPRPQCGKCWHAYRLDIAGAVITDSPPSTPSSWCTALKAGAAEALTHHLGHPGPRDPTLDGDKDSPEPPVCRAAALR